MIVRSTLALISPSSWKTLIRWWVHYWFDKVTQSGGPTPAWLAPCIKFLHQIMSMKQRQELDVHKKPEPYPLTQNSIPNLRLFPPIWVPLLNCLIFCAIQTCLDPLGVWSRKHEASKLLSMFADYISKRESQDPLMIMLGGWMNAAQTVATTHSEGVWGPENPRAGCPLRRAVTLWQSYLDADMHASTSLQLITASIDTSPINSPNALMATWRTMNGVYHDTHIDGDVQLSTIAQRNDRHRVLSQITKEGVENDDIGELGQGVEVNHSSCTMYVSGVIDEKGWEDAYSSWRHRFQCSLGKFFWPSPFPNANHPLCGTRSSNHTIHRRPIHSWHCCWWARCGWNLFGGPTAPVEKLQIVDTRRILSIAWTSTAERLSLKPHIWRPSRGRCKQ